MCVHFALRDSCVRAFCTQVPVLDQLDKRHDERQTNSSRPTDPPASVLTFYLASCHRIPRPHRAFEPAVALQLLVPQPPPEWLAALDLVKREDGKYPQSGPIS